MKTAVFLLALMLSVAGLQAASPEATLVDLQIKNSDIESRYGPNNPKRKEVEAEIAALQARPDLRMDKYFEILQTRLEELQMKRVLDSQKYANQNPIMQQLDTQIACVQSLLRQKKD